jgi:hypothetical protein
MITVGAADSEVSWPTPMTDFAGLSTVGIKLRHPFIVATSQDQRGIRPRMIMHVIRVTLEELVQEHIERKPFAIFEEKVIPFQVRFVVLAIHDHPVTV